MAHQGDQYAALPPLYFNIPEDSDNSQNEFDGVTGMTIPAGWEVQTAQGFRDGRYPERFDRPVYPLDIVNFTFPVINVSEQTA